MKKQPKIYIFLLLIIIFAAPSLAAYLFYQHPSWLGKTRVNKGVLLNSPVVLEALKENTKWGIVSWNFGACDNSCFERLETIAKIRLALGRKLYQVDQWLLLDEKAPTLSEKQQALLKEMDFKVVRFSPALLDHSLFAQSKVFIADPRNYLVLSYAELYPNDIFKDLHLLLNTTKEKE